MRRARRRHTVPRGSFTGVWTMSLIRSEPFSGSDELFNRLVTGSLFRWPRAGEVEWAPAADISETSDEYVIRAQLPAVRKADVKVTVDNGVLTLEGERKQSKEDKSEKFHRVESFRGTFMRSFALPENAEAQSIRCESKDGELIVRIPKAKREQSTVRQIPIA
ncbi:MAG: Hsp20/alpha crystallin family protein [Burkholderiales bacterium]|nr:MAG: Hsp20/alpha crystallin family protein [Burkholderiales bacterium]